MNYLNPIYTEKRECQDCYKCVRNCPVKAIKIENGYASVIPQLCILCGTVWRYVPMEQSTCATISRGRASYWD